MNCQMIFGNSGLIINITSILTMIFIILTFFVAWISLYSDHDRRKKQATIEYFQKYNSNASGPLRMAICKALHEKPIDITNRPNFEFNKR